MNEITSIASKKFFGKYYYRSANNETMSERAKFLMGVALCTVLLPFFLSMGDYMLQLSALSIEGAGALLGYVMFKMASNGFISCVPARRISQTPSGANPAMSKKVA